MVRLWHSVVLIFLFAKVTQAERTVYTFENPSHLSAFIASSPSTLKLTTTRYKDAKHSMKWTWTSGATITHSFTSNVIKRNELKRGGIKLWLYNTRKRVGHNEKLTVSFLDTLTSPGDSSTLSQFNISLNFKGWRGIWVSYQESSVIYGRHIDTLIITALTTTLKTHPLFIDLLRLVSRLSQQTRDQIVPTIGQGIYTPNDFWQQTYRWSLATPTSITSTTLSQDKLDDLALIERRLENWFVKQSQSSVQFTGNVKKRFKSLPVDTSHEKFSKMKIVKSTKGVITGAPLFAKNSDCSPKGESDCGKSGKKFGNVIPNVLLPMAVDYHIRSREVDVNDIATEERTNLNGEAESKNQSIRRIAGADETMQQTFTNALGSASPYSEEDVKEAIATLNSKRKERLFLVLDYIEDQGFTDGSGLGTLDNEMNNAGAGFMSAVFLLRKELQAAGNLPDYLATMKWYNDFGEVYQDPFEYAGTTADRMRTISLWRLFTVLMMPTSTTEEKQKKIRDMEALGRWYANAFSPNEGLAGTLKPDHVGYHHNGYYASAYTPHALHNAALIQYLLSETAFALGAETVGHIKRGLEFMRIVSVKYSSPNSVSGRFPGLSRGILAKNFPAYAYAAATAPVLNDDGSFGEISTFNNETLKMFLRLYDKTESMVNDYLADGDIFSNVYYLNSIGSVNIMEEIHTKANAMNVQAESSPQGCWAKNYAALIIQRREDWAVSVKGFNKYVWDFEASENQNLFGLYQSHGALIVANSEEALLTHDIHNGWDWTRHPGTTTIKMDLDQLVTDDRRYFQPKRLAGGLTLVGGGDYTSGIFGIDFTQPAYRFPSGSFQLDINFSFKKSVFFADHVIICLGTGISSSNSSPNITQTTLFQNKLLDSDNPSSILINTTTHSLSTDLTRESSFFGDRDNAATLRDVNGNGYYIPNPNSQGVNVKISLQTSRDEGDKEKETSARYATAWLNHGINPSDANYEYAIVVNKPANFVQGLATRQASDNKVYEVLQKDNKAHVVKINDCPRTGETQYGYVFFKKSARTLGPVKRVDKAPCIVMVEEVDDNNLYIAVSSPDLNLNISGVLEAGNDINGDERFYSISMPVEIQVYVKNAVNVATGVVRVNGAVVPDTEKANHVTLRHTRGGIVIKFKQLVKGFSKEVKLTRRVQGEKLPE